jgi:hypothetical protein
MLFGRFWPVTFLPCGDEDGLADPAKSSRPWK